MKLKFDVAVIGGGHAGIEAAWLAAKAGARVALITMDRNKIGAMHCNPSVGGLGKGHLVFEVSALGGLMPQLCTTTHLQARMLNTSKGPAVQGLRLQIDKKAYQELASKTLNNTPGITVLEEEAVKILTHAENGKKILTGVVTASGQEILLKSLVIASGTFLCSKIFVGTEQQNCADIFNKTSSELSRSLEEAVEFKLGRLRTGTPPRLAKNSLDFAKMQLQPAHELDFLFEFKPVKSITAEECFITHTTEETKKIITESLSQSAIFSGDIPAAGPRYCPAIELKFVRFPDKSTHHIFVEPETLAGDLIYPAGLSNGLPLSVQQDFIRSIPGFENAKLVRPGFEIEYDFLQPTNLTHTLESKDVAGLFFAGQINGTTGYEEAAAQGAMAGINAAMRALGRPPFIIERWEGYIGVMIDDLVTLGVDEPYRMFTSRAERRLILRQDNVFARLMPRARALGLVDDALWADFCAEENLVKKVWDKVSQNRLKKDSLFRDFDKFCLSPEDKTNLKTRLEAELELDANEVAIISGRFLARIHSLVRYEGYIAREEAEAARMKKYSKIKIPAKFDYASFQGLRRELVDKLIKIQPQTIGQAMQIIGMTPAAISILVVMLGKNRAEQTEHVE